MTKKDYITIANALKPFYQEWNRLDAGTIQSDNTVIDIITAISKALKQDNPKFNPVKFLDYLRN